MNEFLNGNETHIVEFLNKLLAKTKAGEVRWETTADPDRYLVNVGAYGVSIRRVDDDYPEPDDDEPYHHVVQLSKNARELVSFRWDDLDDKEVQRVTGERRYPFVKAVYVEAKKSAINLSAAIDDLNDALDNPRPRQSPSSF